MTIVSVERTRPPVTVLGAGSWGTALAQLLAAGGSAVTLWDRDPAHIARINACHENEKYLPGQPLSERIEGVRQLELAVSTATSHVVVALPSTGIRSVLESLKVNTDQRIVFISAAKGLDGDTGQTMSALIETAVRPENVRGTVALSGPNLAREVIRGIPSVCISASLDPLLARDVQTMFMGPSFRVYTHADLLGVELAGALKNVLAIGAGISDGLGYGDNTKAAMMTRGLMEMTCMGVASGAKAMTFLGIAGVGDLMATASSRLSRNYRVGLGVAELKPLHEVTSGIGQAAEGIPTSKAAYALSRRTGVETPLFDTIHAVLYENKPPLLAVDELMSRPPRQESLLLQA